MSVVDEVKAVITADVAGYTRDVAGATRSAQGLTAEFEKQARQADNLGARIANLGPVIASVGKAGAGPSIDTIAADIRSLAGAVSELESLRGGASGSVVAQIDAQLATLKPQLQSARQEFARLTGEQTASTASTRSWVKGIAPVGVGAISAGFALHALGANFRSLDADAGSAVGKIGNFATAIGSGNVVGAIQALGAHSQLSGDEITKLALSFDASAVAALRAAGGYDVAIGKIQELQAAAQEALQATLSGGSFVARPDVLVPGVTDAGVSSRGPHGPLAGRPGQNTFTREPGYLTVRDAGPAAAAPDSRDLGSMAEAVKPFVWGLSQQLKVAIAAAATTPGKADDIAQHQRGIANLRQQLNAPAIDDEGRLGVYRELAQLQEELAQLEKRKVAAKKREKAAVQEQLISTSSVVGQLGQGPYMTSPTMQFAQSYGYKPKAADYVKDAQAQGAQAAGFNKDLETLRKKGASKALIGELAQQGPTAGAAEADALAGASKKQIGQLNKATEQRQNAAQQTVQLQQMTVRAASVVIQAGKVEVGGSGARGRKSNPGSGNPMHRHQPRRVRDVYPPPT